MDIFTSMEINSSGMSAERKRMNLISSNIANARTTRTEEGGPYKRKDAVFQATPMPELSPEEAKEAPGVTLAQIKEDTSAPKLEYDPTHPDANPEGYVSYPNISVVEEMVNMITATRSYEANAQSVQSAKDMARKALSIGA